jgi:formylglycine-generating enzyme required for sulfatase activity
MKLEFAYPHDPDDRQHEELDAGEEVLRVVRGGDWELLSEAARCAFRFRDLPDVRSYVLGFRVLLRSSLSL